MWNAGTYEKDHIDRVAPNRIEQGFVANKLDRTTSKVSAGYSSRANGRFEEERDGKLEDVMRVSWFRQTQVLERGAGTHERTSIKNSIGT